MKDLNLHTIFCLAGMVFILLALAPAQVYAQAVSAGSDLFETVEDYTFDFHFFSDSGGAPLPADFFGPGSDPFDQPIHYTGAPLNATEDLKNSSCIVERLEPVILPNIGDYATIPVVIRALHLISSITVTYDGGMSPELWQVEMCLSSIASQVPGTMTITRDCLAGGHFTSSIPVKPLLKFTPIEGPGSVAIMDPVPYDPPELQTAGCSYWTHNDVLANPLSIVKSLGGQVDHDCNGVADKPYPATSNFIAGMRAYRCNEVDEPELAGKTLTPGEAGLLLHCVLPPQDAIIIEGEGACCLDNGACIITTEANCLGSGGTYYGDGTLCLGDRNCDGNDELCPLSAYVCGDANGDGAINVGDAVYLINYVFKQGPPPVEPCCP